MSSVHCGRLKFKKIEEKKYALTLIFTWSLSLKMEMD